MATKTKKGNEFGICKKLAAEMVGTAFLLIAVVGSGIMGERLAEGNVALALLVNSLATGAALVVLILIFAEVSGAHFNPAVTFVFRTSSGMDWRHTLLYISAQILGAILGVWVTHAMFGEPILMFSYQIRNSAGQFLGEFVATFGLILTLLRCSQIQSKAVPAAVGLYIMAAYWFTSSTSFANPAVTLARCLTDTFTGIRPLDVPPFILAQFLGGGTALFFFRRIQPNPGEIENR